MTQSILAGLFNSGASQMTPAHTVAPKHEQIRNAIKSGEGWEDVTARAQSLSINAKGLIEIYQDSFMAGEIQHDMMVLAKKRIGANYGT